MIQKYAQKHLDTDYCSIADSDRVRKKTRDKGFGHLCSSLYPGDDREVQGLSDRGLLQSNPGYGCDSRHDSVASRVGVLVRGSGRQRDCRLRLRSTQNRESGQGTYEDIYTTNKMRVDRVIPREEIIEIFLNMRNTERLTRFIQMFNLTPEELAMFYERYVTSVKPTIPVIQEDGTLVYDYEGARKRVKQALDYVQSDEKRAYQKTKLNQQ